MNDKGPHKRARYAWSIPGWASEKPCGASGASELWCYTDKPSYEPRDQVQLFVHSTSTVIQMRIYRDGQSPVTVLEQTLEGDFQQETPSDAYAKGCGWSQSAEIAIGDTWKPGFYIIELKAEFGGETVQAEHFFILKAVSQKARAVMLLTTSTLTAYNDWGGANHYRGCPGDDAPSPFLSMQRPIARGFISKPHGAPRNAHHGTPPPGWIPRHEVYEWAHAHGYSRHHADAFWATYERPFTLWAEQHGYALDFLTQWDLHLDPACLDDYSCVVIVGHDEYWSWEMRDAMDAYLERGGNLARFAGNFVWQIRLSADGQVQTCYKDPRLDPVIAIDPQRLTTLWEHPLINRPSGQTMGLAGISGCYNRYGTTTPRSSGGFTVYRPEHWALKGSDLYYGDVFGGAPACIAAFEVDGAEYGFRKGLPFATGEDGAPLDLEIIAMAPAVIGADDHWSGEVPIGAPADEMEELLKISFAPNPPDWVKDKKYGAGMVASFKKGEGTVFNAGSCEWVNGLIHRDPFTEVITKNVLDKLIV
ncbi:N,N-dimethylformamidase beta subunit family domain-containing protein [Pseudomonas asiatica]|uniref:N,N-dimethylformamidase beta subunit family domain-containing protein n=1 Tax=Pseudomonas asiatica TaxID=2219225 RepID=UPI00383BCAB6